MIYSLLIKVVKVLSSYPLFNSHDFFFLPKFIRIDPKVNGITYSTFCIELFGKLYIVGFESN